MAEDSENRESKLWRIYQMPDGSWAYMACCIISDGYRTRQEAFEAALTQMCEEVVSAVEAGIELEHEILKLHNKIAELREQLEARDG